MAKSKKRNRRKEAFPQGPPGPTWIEHDGVHALIPDEGVPPDLEALSRTYQDEVRNSSLWDTMVAEYGQEKAEKLLKEFKVELRH